MTQDFNVIVLTVVSSDAMIIEQWVYVDKEEEALRRRACLVSDYKDIIRDGGNVYFRSF